MPYSVASQNGAPALRASCAGSGNPYAVLSPLRLRLVRGLHDRHSWVQLAADYGLMPGEVYTELLPLVEASLVARDGDRYYPTFLVVTAEETARVHEHANGLGAELSHCLLAAWDEIEGVYGTLACSREAPFADAAFLFAGDRILDVGLLDTLAGDGRLMPPAPARPSPQRPDARYYFWLIEGDDADTGAYGQRGNDLPWEHWHLLTFGQYFIGDESNTARDTLEACARNLLAAEHVSDPEILARRLGVPYVSVADAREWQRLANTVTPRLAAVYAAHEAELRTLYGSLRAHAYAPHGFAEFCCWYDHLAYSAAIDVLAAAGALRIPRERFAAAVWHELPQAAGFGAPSRST